MLGNVRYLGLADTAVKDTNLVTLSSSSCARCTRGTINLLYFCMQLQLLISRPSAGREMSSSVAGWGDGVSASCTLGPIVH